jgi:hypothetical protein
MAIDLGRQDVQVRPPRAWEWLWRGEALRAARSNVAAPSTLAREHLQRARVATELADRALDPVDPLRAGSGVALALSLYREAAYWSLLANGVAAGASDVRQAFAAAPPDLLLYAAGSEDELASVRAALAGKTFVDTAADTPPTLERDARQAKAFVHALLVRAAGPEERVGELLLQRWFRTAMLLLVLSGAAVTAGVAAMRANESPDLAAGKPWRASSKLADCKPKDRMCAGTRTAILFHTLEQKDPWFEIDLQAPKRFSVVEVLNREDCCPDRALPLVVEVGTDQKSWRVVARRSEPFSSWRAEFKPVTARYVRLRVPRHSILHLERVTVHAR